MFKCIFCNQEFKTLKNISKHVSRCEQSPEGESVKQKLYEKIYVLNRQILYSEYIENNLSVNQIKEKYKIQSSSIVNFLLSQYRICKHSKKEQNKLAIKNREKINLLKYGVKINFNV